MRYDILSSTASAMPKPSKGTEICKLLLSQASKTMLETLVPVLFPLLGVHMSGVKFQHPDLIWKELCGQMDNLVAENGGNKRQLSYQMEAICRDFRHHDEAELPTCGFGAPHRALDREAVLYRYRGVATSLPDRTLSGQTAI